MIDLEGLPQPDNAPEPGTCIRIERPRDGLAVLVLDPPHRTLAVLDAPLLRDLDSAIDEIEADGSIRGVVITGRTPHEFAAGADVEAIEAVDDPSVVEKVVLEVHKLFRRIEGLRARTVAAVGGACPGGAYELSLCCDRIVATDDSKTRIGLPETMLGILPGWGGSHRLPKRVGVPKALDAILTGRLYPAKRAKRLGMIDRTTKPDYLLEVAGKIALGEMKCMRDTRGVAFWLVDRNPLAEAIIGRQVRKQVMSKTRGHYPAPLRALELVLQAPGVDMERAAQLEAQAVRELATSSVCKSLISIFFAQEEAKKLGRGTGGEKAREFTHGGVIGAGVMGGAIASMMAEKGLWTRLFDLAPDALDRAQIEHRKGIEKKRKRRRLQPHAADGAIDRLDVSPSLSGFQRAQIVVEAVAERIDIKQDVLGRLAEQVADDAVLATNTSSLSVDAIAEGLPHPERICGMHFFNPVRKMPLVEVIRGRDTSSSVITAVCALALRMGKTPVVVKDVPGFLVNRVLGPYLDEAVRLFVEGADPERLDKALVAFGMPMGPLTLLDEVGLDIARHAAASLHEAYGERMQPSDGLDALATPERLGKKTGKGFYNHPKGRKAKPELCPDLTNFQRGQAAMTLGGDQLADRCVLAMVNEAVRCLEEGVVASPAELDLATVFGTGFAPFHGGVLRYADSLGAAEVVRRLEACADASDVRARGEGAERFRPAELLRTLAREGGKLRDHVVASEAPPTAVAG